MEIDTNRLNEEQRLLLDHIMIQYPDKDQRRSLLTAIHMAFLFNKDSQTDPFSMPISPYLVSALATCSITLLRENRKRDIPGHLLIIIMQTFMANLIVAYHDGMVKTINDQLCFGKFILPEWFANYAKKVTS